MRERRHGASSSDDPMIIEERPKTVSRPKKRKRRQEDPAYRPRTAKRIKAWGLDSKSIIYSMRAHSGITVTKDGSVFHKKTAVLVNEACIKASGKPPAEFKQNFSKHTRKIRTHRPIAKVTNLSVKGSPHIIETPGGAKLKKRSSNGILTFFSNVSPANTSLQKNEVKAESFPLSSPFAAVRENPVLIKHKRIKLTHTWLKQVYEEAQGNNFRRKPAQSVVMAKKGVNPKKASATRYAHAAGFLPQHKWEWMHLIAYSYFGGAGQNAENLGCGTAYANTEMMCVERMLGHFTEKYPEGVWLDVEAHFAAGTQILTKIYYTIITPDVTLPFAIDAQQTNRPDIHNEQYVDALFEAFEELALETLPARKQLTYF